MPSVDKAGRIQEHSKTSERGFWQGKMPKDDDD